MAAPPSRSGIARIEVIVNPSSIGFPMRRAPTAPTTAPVTMPMAPRRSPPPGVPPAATMRAIPTPRYSGWNTENAAMTMSWPRIHPISIDPVARARRSVLGLDLHAEVASAVRGRPTMMASATPARRAFSKGKRVSIAWPKSVAPDTSAIAPPHAAIALMAANAASHGRRRASAASGLGESVITARVMRGGGGRG